MSQNDTTKPDPEKTLRLLKAVFSYERAVTELRRANDVGTQPRMQKAGNRIFMARGRMFLAARELNSAKS